MPFVIEQFGVRTTSGDPTSAEIPYAVWGVPTSEIARAMVIEASPPTYTVNEIPLFRKQATVEETGPEAHIVHVIYGPIKPPESRGTSSHSIPRRPSKITQSLATVHNTPAGKTAADHKGAHWRDRPRRRGLRDRRAQVQLVRDMAITDRNLRLGLFTDAQVDHRKS